MYVFKLEVLSNNQEFGADLICVLLDRYRRIGICANCRLTRTIDVCFFPTDGFASRPKVSRVINTDACNDGDRRLNCVNGVQAAAQTDL